MEANVSRQPAERVVDASYFAILMMRLGCEISEKQSQL
jgi:hypothetical protein